MRMSDPLEEWEEESLNNSQDDDIQAEPLIKKREISGELHPEDPLLEKKDSLWMRIRKKIDPKMRKREYAFNAKFKEIKKLPPRSKRYWSWQYEVLRPWEPQPAKNYYKLLHKENPWLNQPPSGSMIFFIAVLFLLFNYCIGFMPFIINISTFQHRLTVIRTPTWLQPWWFNIFCCAFAHTASAVSVWFLYLTGGFYKRYKLMIPYFIMLAFEAIWPDAIFSWRLIALSTTLLGICIVLCVVCIVLFWSKIEYSGCLLFFLLALYCYEFSLLVHVWIINGPMW